MNLFQRIDRVLTDVRDGWCSKEKAHLLASSVVAMRPEVIVEIGVWAGRSLFPMALACQEVGFGKVIGIDPWSAEASADGMEGEHKDWWSKAPHQRIYEEFTSNVIRYGLSEWVDIRRAKSDDVQLFGSFSILHCDGNHGEQAVRDIDRFAAAVHPGGLVFCDDVSWENGGVGEAIEHLKALGFVKLMDMDTGALFKRM